MQLQEVVDYITCGKESAGLTFEQFADLLRVSPASSLQARLRQRFDIFDADQSGRISLEKFTASVRRLDGLVTTAEASAMFNDCDLNGSSSMSVQKSDNHGTDVQCGRQMLLKLPQRTQCSATDVR